MKSLSILSLSVALLCGATMQDSKEANADDNNRRESGPSIQKLLEGVESGNQPMASSLIRQLQSGASHSDRQSNAELLKLSVKSLGNYLHNKLDRIETGSLMPGKKIIEFDFGKVPVVYRDEAIVWQKAPTKERVVHIDIVLRTKNVAVMKVWLPAEGVSGNVALRQVGHKWEVVSTHLPEQKTASSWGAASELRHSGRLPGVARSDYICCNPCGW